MSERDELDKWVEKQPDRLIVEEFLEWCDSQGYQVCAWRES